MATQMTWLEFCDVVKATKLNNFSRPNWDEVQNNVLKIHKSNQMILLMQFLKNLKKDIGQLKE